METEDPLSLPHDAVSAAVPTSDAGMSGLRWLGWTLVALIAPFALHAGQAFFVPLFVSLFVSFTLAPLVDRLERWHIPRALGAALVMVLVVGLGSVVVKLTLNGASDVLEELPHAVQRLRVAVTSWELYGDGPLKQVRRTADELKKLAGATTGTTAVAAPAAETATPAATMGADPQLLVANGTMGAMVFVGQLATMIFLTYFLLAAGDHFRRRLIQIHGPVLSTRKRTLQILRAVHHLSQRYFALLVAGNVVVGAATALGLYLLGVRHPLFWGIAVAILHAIPYVGTAAAAVGIGIIAYTQFQSAELAFAAAGVPVAAALLIGFWLHTALLARAGRMNTVMIFVALLFWGTVWGGWGLLLAFPIMATIRIVFSEIERLRPLAVLMGD